MHDLLRYSALELSALFESGDASPLELTRAAIERQSATDQVVNTSYLQTPELALEQAEASERRWLNGTALSAFDGIPTTVKDGLFWAGHPVYRGFAGSADNPPMASENAAITDRMLEAGMVLLGKTTMPDFGMLATGYSSRHGITRNPWDTTKNPVGSSSGAAAAVAAGAYPVVVGTDIVGSIRLPASFCGLFGLKPSQGRVPYVPPASPALVAGPMTRTVADAAVFMNILSQPDRRDCTALPSQDTNYLELLESTPGKLRLGLLENLNLGVGTDPEVAAAIQSAASLLQDQGHDIVSLDSTLVAEDLLAGEIYYRQRVFNELSRRSDEQQQSSPYMYRWSRASLETSPAELFDASQRLWDVRLRLEQMLADVDFLLCPTVPYPAFDAELPARNENRLFEPWAHTFLFNLGEQPAASINCGFSSEGLHIGLQIVGQRFDDLGVLQLSRQFEQLCDHCPQPPREMP